MVSILVLRSIPRAILSLTFRRKTVPYTYTDVTSSDDTAQYQILALRWRGQKKLNLIQIHERLFQEKCCVIIVHHRPATPG